MHIFPFLPFKRNGGNGKSDYFEFSVILSRQRDWLHAGDVLS